MDNDELEKLIVKMSNVPVTPYYNSYGNTGPMGPPGLQGPIGPPGFSYFQIKKEQLKVKLDILNAAFNLDIEDYKVYLNLINSDDEANLEIANGLLANLHNNYNITKK